MMERHEATRMSPGRQISVRGQGRYHRCCPWSAPALPLEGERAFAAHCSAGTRPRTALCGSLKSSERVFGTLTKARGRRIRLRRA